MQTLECIKSRDEIRVASHRRGMREERPINGSYHAEIGPGVAFGGGEGIRFMAELLFKDDAGKKWCIKKTFNAADKVEFEELRQFAHRFNMPFTGIRCWDRLIWKCLHAKCRVDVRTDASQNLAVTVRLLNHRGDPDSAGKPVSWNHGLRVWAPR